MATFRHAKAQDIPKVHELQRRNLLPNLEPEDQQDGFLSIEYTPEQLEWLNQELGIFVAVEKNRLSGYLIAQKTDLALESPLIAAMVGRFPDILYHARPLSECRAFIYGPVCIDKESRGQGILQGLYALMLKTLKGQYDVGVAFVSEKNRRSLYAHRDKLGLEVIDEFEFNGQRYNTLVFWAGATGAEN